MPDDNKFKKLREIGYRIPQLCCYCTHGIFGTSGWGTCEVHRYDHQKHDNPEGGRGVSIHSTGTCKVGFEADYARIGRAALGAHLEFFNVEPEATNGSGAGGLSS